MENEIKEYIEHIHRKFTNRYKVVPKERQEYHDEVTATFKETTRLVKGSTYIKVVTNNSAHSLIVLEDTKGFKKGDILKAASWKAPAKNFIRGNVYTPSSYINVDWEGA